ncbi:MAG TPA: DNA polymerase III subunit alpha, partial [Gemmataceae bacterium]|nr:DNA polymerase III subunit alpha [Gemmataceae bacterium]
RRLGLRPVASTAAHFADPADYATFRLVTAMRRGIQLDQLPRELPLTPAHHLVGPAEFHRRFRDLPAALHNGDLLAEQLRSSDILPRDLVLPQPRLRAGLDPMHFLHRLCERGLRQRDLGVDLAARERLREELALIETAGLAGYFLVVRDITRHVRRCGHTMALRGSAGNSLVCYLLGITDVDPLRFRLPLERFLHPGRTDLPDIDLDFDWKVRDEVIDYVFQRYGAAHVARICTHLLLQPRSAFREAGKLHGLSNEQISELMTTLSESVEELLAGNAGAAPQTFPLEAERWPRLVADARRLLGRPHHLSLHPGGVVVTPGPIEEYVPLEWAAKGVVVTQFEKDAVEAVGLVKIDLLGNRSLATVDEAKAWATKPPARSASDGFRQNPSLALRADRATAFDHEPATLALLHRGDTVGIPQLESPAMRHLLIQTRPGGVEETAQVLALVRPGAALIGAKACFVRRRRGLEPAAPLHPRLAELLGDTENLMIYEDDALQVIQRLTGLAAPDADRFRRRVTKHRTPEEAQTLLTEFLDLCRRQGVPDEPLTEVWAQLAKFNQYSFCKSHAVSYGLIAWQAAWLKAHHPVPFWTAALNNNQSAYPRRVYIEAMKRAGIRILLPCINRSAGPFRPEDGGVRVGLDAIGGLPEELRATLLQERDKNGPFQDLADFRRRIRPGPEALDLLVRCGALDFTGRPRPALFLEADLQDRIKAKGPELLPCRPADDWSPPDYDDLRRLRDEWSLLGFVVGPPLFSLFRKPRPRAGPPFILSNQLPEYRGRLVRLRGVVATARRAQTRKGGLVQFISLEDEYGLAETSLFPGECPAVPYLTMGPYTVTGTVEEQYGVFTITARGFERIDSGQ